MRDTTARGLIERGIRRREVTAAWISTFEYIVTDGRTLLADPAGCGGETPHPDAGMRDRQASNLAASSKQRAASKPARASGKPAQTRRSAFCLLPAGRGKQKPARTRRPTLPFLSSTAHASNPPTAHTTAATRTLPIPPHRIAKHPTATVAVANTTCESAACRNLHAACSAATIPSPPTTLHPAPLEVAHNTHPQAQVGHRPEFMYSSHAHAFALDPPPEQPQSFRITRRSRRSSHHSTNG